MANNEVLSIISAMIERSCAVLVTIATLMAVYYSSITALKENCNVKLFLINWLRIKLMAL